MDKTSRIATAQPAHCKLLSPSPRRWPLPNRRMATLIALIPFLLGLVAAQPLPAATTLKFLKNINQVRAKGVTAGGDVLFLSASKEQVDWTRKVVSRLDFATANSNGVAKNANVLVIDPSIWAAVDLSTGSFKVASPSGQYDPVNVNQAELVTPSDFAYAGERLDLVVLRGKNAWHARAQDGGGSDRGPSQDGHVGIAFESLTKVYPNNSIGTSGAYDAPRTGDLLIGIDADQMVYFTLIVTDTSATDL